MLATDVVSAALTGKWIWKDDSNTLEFISHAGGNLDRQEKKKRKGHQEHAKTRNDKISSSVGNRSFGASRANVRHIRSPRPIVGKAAANAVFTLDDIKTKTLQMYSEVNQINESFYTLFLTEQFDDFLLHMLTYFHQYFVKLDLDSRPKDMYIEPGIKELETYADVCSRVEVAQKLLGQSYSVLVLGLGLDDMHHMTCGHSRVSSTLKDRGMYETFYSYCSLFVWICFKRKDRPTVRKEVGRILRSDTFNPAIRVKNAPNAIISESDEKAATEHEVKLTPAQYRRLHGKRPAIQSIISQRSPAVVAIIPLPKEESHDLFERKSLQDKPWSKEDDQYDAIEKELANSIKNLKVGILGDSVSLYNQQNLVPLLEEKNENENGNPNQVGILGDYVSLYNQQNLMPLSEDKDENENANQSDKLADGVVTDAGKPLQSADKVSRQLTSISQATTEAFADED